MKVFAYDDDKRTYAIDLPAELIASNNIDPWRLDLFDPDPIRLAIGRKQLNFRRLRDICFSYYSDLSKTFCLAVHDGHHAFCGDTVFDPRFRRPSSHSFVDHFCEYLHYLEETAEPDDKDYEVVAHPRPSSAISLSAGELILGGESFSMSQPTFVGDMFSEVSHPVALPESMNLVLREFQQWDPVLLGMGVPDKEIRRVVAGNPARQLAILIEPEAHPAIEKRFPKDSAVPSWFQHDDCRFHLWGSRSSMTIPGWFRRVGHYHSVSYLYCTKPNEVTGSRIAFFDISKGQTRNLLKVDPEPYGSDIYTEKLIEEGLVNVGIETLNSE